MKRLAILLGLTMVAGALYAEEIFTEDFNDWYNNKQVQWDSDWLGVGNNGGLKGDGAGKANRPFSWRGGIQVVNEANNIAPGDTVVISFDYQFENTNSLQNVRLHSFGLVDVSTNKAGNSYIAGFSGADMENMLGPSLLFSEYPNPGSGQPTSNGTVKVLSSYSASNADSSLANAEVWGHAGNTAADHISDEVRVTYTAEKSYAQDMWTVSVGYSNLTSGANGAKSGLSVSNAAAYSASTLRLAFHQYGLLHVSGEAATNSTIDNIAVRIDRKPQLRTVLEDDFSTPAYTNYQTIYRWEIADIWNEGQSSGNSHWVTGGVCRANIGWRGVANSTLPTYSSSGETVRVSFDYMIDLGTTAGSSTHNLGDFCMVPDDGVIFTNSWNGPAIAYDGYGTNGMSARISFNAWKGPSGSEFPDGRVVIQLANGTATYFDDPSVLGLSPVVGADPVSDNLQVQFDYQKTGVAGDWNVITKIYNVDTDMTYASTQTVVNAAAKDVPLFFALRNEGGIPTDGTYQLDNLKVQVQAVPLPLGYNGWTANWPGEDLSDPYADNDGDGIDNVTEYALGGDPTVDVASDSGIILPVLVYGLDNNVNYYHPTLVDPDADVTYIVERNDNLVSGTWVDTGWNQVTNYPTANPDFNEQKHRTWGGSKSRHFFRLRVTQP